MTLRAVGTVVLSVLLCLNSGMAPCDVTQVVASHPGVKRLKSYAGDSFIWKGKMESRPEPLDERQRQTMQEQCDRMLKEMDQISDPELRDSNKAKIRATLESQLNGSVKNSKFTLSYSPKGYVWEIEEDGNECVIVTAINSDRCDFIAKCPSTKDTRNSLQRSQLIGVRTLYEEFPWGFDPVQVAKAYEKVEITGNQSVFELTFTKRIPDNTIRFPVWLGMRMRYDLSVSNRFPVSVEALSTKETPPAVRRSAKFTFGQPEGAPFRIPQQMELVQYRKDAKAHLILGLKVESVEHPASVDFAALTRWEDGTVVSDDRFDMRAPFQYVIKPGLTEAEIVRQAQEHYKGNFRLAARDKRRRTAQMIFGAGVLLLAVTVAGYRYARRQG